MNDYDLHNADDRNAVGPNRMPMRALRSLLFGRISTGQLIDLIAQTFAAMNPLPAPPAATNDVATDVGNLITYQGSLASYAKKNAQVRALGFLVGKLLG
jgi:hypothetical protein